MALFKNLSAVPEYAIIKMLTETYNSQNYTSYTFRGIFFRSRKHQKKYL